MALEHFISVGGRRPSALARDPDRLERIENVVNFDTLMSGDTFENDCRQYPVDLGVERDCHSLKPRI
jgi:hypothetical protein